LKKVQSESVSGIAEIEHLGGVVRKLSIGTDISKRITYNVGTEVLRGAGVKISSILVKRDFLEKFGKVHAVINVYAGKGNERVWMEIVDTIQIENDISDLMK
jgi:hypothetical protein